MNSEGQNFKHLVHLDEKSITPNDKIGSGLLSIKSSDTMMGEIKIKRPNSFKSIIGQPNVYDLKGNLLASEENLVVMIGREYLAQLLARTQGNNPNDYTFYRVTHFGVGTGGTSNDCPPTTNGPFDDDLDLENRVVIRDPIAGGYYPDYADDGKLKLIESDGEITVINEEHTLNVPGGGQSVVDAFTAVRYRMYLQPTEPKDKPFRFNEAGLYAMEYVFDNNIGEDVPTGNHLLFARFTTLDKYLEAADGIMIEWFILV